MSEFRSQPKSATPTPWVADPDWREGYSWNIHIVDAANPDMRICFMTSDGPAQANADLIVEAVNNYASLKARIEELEAALRFYADMRRYDGPNQKPIPGDQYADQDAVYIKDVTRDRGQIARDALEAKHD